MSLNNIIVNYISTRMISPECFGFAPYIFDSYDCGNYRIGPRFPALTGLLDISVSEPSRIMRVVYRRD